MLNSILWSSFFATTGLVLVIYYIAIGYLFYRKDFPQIVRRLIDTKRVSSENATDYSTEEKETIK